MGPARRVCLGHIRTSQHGAARRLRHLLCARRRGLGGPAQLPGALPAGCFRAGAGRLPVIDLTFVPCLGLLQGFAGNDPNGAPTYACNGPGIPSTNIFGLVVPRKFVSPNTQQWNLTLQREFGKDWVLEVGYVGTHSIHLRETRTNLSVNVSPTD